MKRPRLKPPVQESDSAGRKAASKTSPFVATVGIGSTQAPRVNPQWAWHYRVLLGLRERFLKERAEQLKEAAEPLEPHSMDLADSATDEFDRDMALSELSAEQDALYEVEKALKRILNGTYGVCEETGKPIPEERLRAIPWTRFGKEVEERLEGKGVVNKPHLGALGSVRAKLTGDLEESESEEENQPPPAEDESLREIPSLPAKAEREPVVPGRQRNRGGHARRRGSPAKSHQG